MMHKLVNKFSGTGTAYGNKEVVDAGSIIGNYYDLSTGKYVETTRFTIHYSSKGTHIVPAPPNP
jgi:hypothetical protein